MAKNKNRSNSAAARQSCDKPSTKANGSTGRKWNGARNGKVTNDFAWWNKYPQLTEGAAAFPFNRIGGEPIGLEGTTTPFPGVYVYTYLPTIGRSISPESPFMAQVRSVWLDMHRKYRGIGTYQVSDLGVFIFTTINAFAELARAEKIYGYFRGIDVYNRNIPQILVEACDVEWNPSVKELANFRQAINRLNQRASQICLPKGFSAYQDAIILASATLKDAESKRAQIATFNAYGFYSYSGTAYPTGSAALFNERSHSGPNGRQTFNDIIDDLNLCLDPLFNDNDCQRMASDILAAYSENGIETKIALDEDFVSPIAKDDVRLLQLHNASILCGTTVLAGGSPNQPVLANVLPKAAIPTAPTIVGMPGRLDIVQANDILYSDLHIVGVGTGFAPTYEDSTQCTLPAELDIPSLGSQGFWIPSSGDGGTETVARLSTKINDRILDTWSDSVSTEEKMEMTRFTVPVRAIVFADSSNTPVVAIKPLAWGTNVFLGLQPFVRNTTTGAAVPLMDIPQAVNQLTVPGVGLSTQLTSMYFDWAPIMYWQVVNLPSVISPGDKLQVQGGNAFGDIDHFTVIKDDSDVLRFLHEAALLSAYRCELVTTAKFDVI